MNGIWQVLLVLSTIIERLIEYTLGTIMDRIVVLKPYKWVLIFPQLAFGMGICWVIKWDVMPIIWPDFPIVGWLGVLLTGALIGGGSELVHLFFELLKTVRGNLQVKVTNNE